MIHHLADVESDMSAIHGIRNIYDLEAGYFFRLARRLPAYQGVMRSVVESEMTREQRRKGNAERIVPLHDPRQLAGDGVAGLFDIG